MLDLLLYEVECAENAGDFKTADALDSKLVKIAVSNRLKLKRDIFKKFNSPENSIIKSVRFSSAKNKFIITIDRSANFSLKKKITHSVAPFGVSFRYSSLSPEMESIRGLEKEFPGDDKIEFDDFDREPTDEEMNFTSEFPDDESLLNDYLNDLLQQNSKYYDLAEELANQGLDYHQIQKIITLFDDEKMNKFQPPSF